MNRLSITLNDTLDEKLRDIQGGLIKGRKADVSFTATVNTVLLAGILASDKLDEKDWAMIRGFLDEEELNLNKEGLTDNFINRLK
ncbi:MAG: hypothetical protein HY223_05225 [Thaumarchaeota archaeon]|nr:hypothetical protein [Nitrososphaerota archaeon]